MSAVLSCALVSIWCGAEAISLPPGTTALSDAGLYAVTYQVYGEKPVEMPVSWTGHFADPGGISYMPGERVLGREALLLHCPWRQGAGRVWVDYRFALPALKPINLSFGIAMRPDVAVEGKSDGAEFACLLISEGEERELMRTHWAQGAWQDYDFDLSAYAGKTVVIRLETGPGPARDSGWDYAYFGGARITCGDEQDAEAALASWAIDMDRDTSDLRAWSNSAAHGVLPSSDPAHAAAGTIRADGAGFVFTSACGSLDYRYQPRTGTLNDITARCDSGPAFHPAAGGGVFAADADGIPGGGPLQAERLIEAAIDPGGEALRTVWRYEAGGESFDVTWRFGARGAAMTVEAGCENPVISSLSLGRASAPLRKRLPIPYLYGEVEFLPQGRQFVCRYLDWTRSHASRCPQGEATYEPKTDGARNPLYETGYIAVSPNIHNVLPNIPHAPSPYLEQLGPLVMLDIWRHHDGTFQGDARNLRNLKDNGVDHLAIISHVWQRYGYDVKLPDHIPANPDFGGEEGMAAFGAAANECGYLWSLHENYIDLYPDAPSFDPDAVVLRADGTRSPAWYNSATGVQSFGLKCNRALGYAGQNAPAIHKRYGTAAAYLDVHTCVPPWHQLDHDAAEPMAAMALLKVQRDGELFDYMRAAHGGPLFGEGSNHFYWAGRCDGAEAQVAGGEDHSPFLDFDLLKLHPQMVNHGMGYYERWFRRGYEHQWGRDTGTPGQIDKYRAQEIAYGHAGFIGNAQTDNVQWVAKEHHMMHAAQRLTGAAKVTDIRYEAGGHWLSGGAALALGRTARQRIAYGSGATVWVNWSEAPWVVEGRTLPQWGFLVTGPDTLVCLELRDGVFTDYAECPEYVFADARTAFTMPYRDPPVDIEPRLARFEYLGGNEMRLTYEWTVNESLDDEPACFVHFLNAASPGAEGIVFQQDHALPEPVSQWRPGEIVVDGPHRAEVPADGFDTYDIVAGLHSGERVDLKGTDIGGRRILLGRLRVTREEGRITDITLEPADGALEEAARETADFEARMNPPGTWADFGKAATSGSVKVNKGDRRLVVFPYPRGEVFDVAIDVGAFGDRKTVPRDSVTLHALAAGTQEDLGAIPFTWEGRRIRFPTGQPHVGRYVVSW